MIVVINVVLDEWNIWLRAVLDIEWGNDTAVLEIVVIWGYSVRFYTPAACGMTIFEDFGKRSPGV